MKWWWGPLCSRPTRLVGFYSASSLERQSANRHVAPLGHIILIPSQSVFLLFHECCTLSRQSTNTICIVFGLTRSGLEPTIYHTRGEHANHNTTDAVATLRILLLQLHKLWLMDTKEKSFRYQCGNQSIGCLIMRHRYPRWPCCCGTIDT